MSPSISNWPVTRLSLLQELVDLVKAGPSVVAFDRDGTLVPYADRSEQAFLDQQVLKDVQALAAIENVFVAVISARSVAQLEQDFGNDRIILAGNYGFEIKFPGQPLMIEKAAMLRKNDLQEVHKRLSSEVGLLRGAILEDHGLSLCLHFNLVEPSSRQMIHDAVRNALEDFPLLTLRILPTSYEILPDLVWDKGIALAAINTYLGGVVNRNDGDGRRLELANVFAGDSDADEPAICWVNDRGGVSIKVGPLEAGSNARHRLETPQQLHELIDALLARLRS
jgi:trehalose 6-phosphate phosphatase